MRPTIQNMRKLLNRRTMTLLGVGLLLLAAVAANVIMNRNEERLVKADTAAVSVSAPRHLSQRAGQRADPGAGVSRRHRGSGRR